VQLGFFPRVTVTHTSRDAEGQIYVPEINWMLAIACVALVIAFKESSRLAAAYGIAVTGTMAITSIVYFEVTRTTWKWPLGKSLALLVLFLSFDLPFFGANLFKFVDGGYVPVLAGAVIFVIMINWKTGRRIYREHVAAHAPPFDEFLATIDGKLCARTPGSGVFLSAPYEGVPAVLVQHVERLHVLPETVLLLTVVVTHAPYEDDGAMRLETLSKGFHRLTIDRGFMDATDIPHALGLAIARFDLPIDLKTTTYYLSRETFLATSAGKMGAISESLFAFLARNAKTATSQFGIPPMQVVEIGSQIDL
jgi:KUP system potassium uptake protein